MKVQGISAGAVIIGIGVLHTVVGLALGAAPLGDIVRHGYVGAVDGHFDRLAIAWFLLFGFAFVLAGDAIRVIERSGRAVPPRLVYGLGAIALIGAAAMPVSGFWLVLVPVGMLIARAPRERAAK